VERLSGKPSDAAPNELSCECLSLIRWQLLFRISLADCLSRAMALRPTSAETSVLLSVTACIN
jgi:hypothetical protein